MVYNKKNHEGRKDEALEMYTFRRWTVENIMVDAATARSTTFKES